MKKSTMIILAMIPCILWASVFPVLKTLFQEVDISNGASSKIALGGMRFFIAGLLILLTSTIMNKKIPVPAKGQFKNIFVVGLLSTTGLYGLYFVGLELVTGVKASVITQSGIFYIIILAHFILKERIKKNQLIGMIFGIIGIITLNITGIAGDAGLFSFKLGGEGLLLLSGLFGSLGQIYVKKYCKDIPAMTLTGWQMTLGGGILLILGMRLNGGIVYMTTTLSYLLMLYAIMVSAVGFTLWFYLIKKVDINDVVLYRLSIPVLGSIFSAIFLPGESITVNIMIGLSFVVIGMYFISNPGLMKKYLSKKS